jgi:hypothetical protein
MAIMMECDACEHPQLVGLIDNGIGGFPNPHQKCEKCGVAGRYSAPGAKKRLEGEIRNVIVAISNPKDTDLSKLLQKIAP